MTRLSASGSALLYSSYLGGGGEDYGNGIALDGAGGAYLTGYTLSGDFPTTPGAYDITHGGTAKSDAFVVKIGEPVQDWETTITYTYDPLYRLTGAGYSTGEFFEYAYDAVGNRLSETTEAGTTTYTYDVANRLTSVNGVTYTWDDNGNLLSDGANTYSYDHANRLVSVVGAAVTSSYAYNGLGDRLQQTLAGVTENYTLDINGWLSQVLADGTNTYLYGSGRIAQYDAAGAEYFLGDALGSVRQLVGTGGEVVLAEAYEPYGESMASAGNGVTSYGFTGEWRDPTGLIFLQARYYAPDVGRFLSRDIWKGDLQQPMSDNSWLYVYANPINLTDPSGHSPFLPPPCLTGTARQCVNFASWQYSKNGPILLAGALWGGRFDCNNREWSMPVNARELLADYICERGPEHVIFGGSDALTKELAYARVMDKLRKRFYREGNIPNPGESPEFKFNPPEFLVSLEDILLSGKALPIVHFLGSFDYQVVQFSDVRTKTNRIIFRIDNQTDLSSGTHLPERFPPEDQRENPLSLEEVITNQPLLAYMPASALLAFYHDSEGNPIVSILRPRTRDQTGGAGAGAMTQTFVWTERNLECGLEKLPWPVILLFIDVQ